VKIEKTGTSFLREGDTITVAISHEIKINGDASWVRYEATSKINQETSEVAGHRIIGHVNEYVMKAVEATVNHVNGVGN